MASGSGWIDRPMTGFDTETTGVDVDVDRIVTAALVHRAGQVVQPGGAPGTETGAVTSWLIDPGVPIPAAATAVHGIDTATAREHGRAPAAAVDEIADALVAALCGGEPVVAYNAAYDLTLLDVELSRHGLACLADRLGGPVAPILDPLVLDRATDPYRPGKRRLGDLCAHYGLATGPLHNADADVTATLDVLAAIVAAHPEIGLLDLAAVHVLQVDGHRRWAESFNTWRISKGFAGEGASASWPMRPATVSAG